METSTEETMCFSATCTRQLARPCTGKSHRDNVRKRPALHIDPWCTSQPSPRRVPQGLAPIL
eukprot:6338652-Pyramimonas_sp.AAC.1